MNLLEASDDYLRHHMGPGTLANRINNEVDAIIRIYRQVHDVPAEMALFMVKYEAVMALTDFTDIYWNALLNGENNE